MFATPLYPLFLSLAGKSCLIAGFGNVGRRKFNSLILCKPKSIAIFDPFIKLNDDEMTNLASFNAVLKSRTCTHEDILNAYLVFAATGSKKENARIAKICKDENILCNSATDPENGSFIVPSTIRKGKMCCALSTSGQSPGLSLGLKTELSDWLAKKEPFARLMGLLRPHIVADNACQSTHKDIFNKLAQSPLKDYTVFNDAEKCFEILCEYLPHISKNILMTIVKEWKNDNAC